VRSCVAASRLTRIPGGPRTRRGCWSNARTRTPTRGVSRSRVKPESVLSGRTLDDLDANRHERISPVCPPRCARPLHDEAGADAANTHAGHRADRHRRFSDPGWIYERNSTAGCAAWRFATATGCGLLSRNRQPAERNYPERLTASPPPAPNPGFGLDGEVVAFEGRPPPPSPPAAGRLGISRPRGCPGLRESASPITSSTTAAPRRQVHRGPAADLA